MNLHNARAKKPPTGVIINTTTGKLSGNIRKFISVPNPRGSLISARKISAIE